MLMAGHETTGTALAWTFDRILSLPEVERRLREELDTVTAGGSLLAEHLLRLEYLDAVVKETLRIRPIMPAGGARLVRRPIEIGGRTIEPPAILVNAMYLLHRRPELYADPESFKPERFVRVVRDEGRGRHGAVARAASNRESERGSRAPRLLSRAREGTARRPRTCGYLILLEARRPIERKSDR
jgi:cytochrome P450